MIKYALICDCGHAFEAWFRSSDDYDAQKKMGAVECVACGSAEVKKQIMSPAVKCSKKSARRAEAFSKFAGEVRDHIAKTHVYVGDKFADEARAMHLGEKDEAPIYGEATPTEAKTLKDEGVPAAPLPPPFAPAPPKKLN